MTVEKPKPKQLLRPITIGTNSAKNQSQFLAIIWNLLKAREKSRVHGAIGFGFASHWLKNWRESFKPIIKCGNHNHVIIFESFENCSNDTDSVSPNDFDGVILQRLYMRTAHTRMQLYSHYKFADAYP